MKFIIFLVAFTYCLNLSANTNFINCSSLVDYHDGMIGNSEFKITKNNSTTFEWDYGEYSTKINFDTDLPQFKLNIAMGNLVLVNQDIILNEPIDFKSAGIDYSLLCL